MKNMDSLETSKNKILFKKRTLRPWKPTIMDVVVDESSFAKPDEALNPIKSIDINPIMDDKKNDLTRSQIEQVLDAKQVECNGLAQQLREREENRLLIGGFIYPRNIFFLTEDEKIQKTNFLMNELKTKEQEILLLALDLKVAKAVEQAENAEIARRKEEEARLNSEERALFAIQQAKKTAEQVYKVEQQISLEKQLRLEIENEKKFLEEKVASILNELETKEQKMIEALQAKKIAEEKATYALEYASVAEQNARKNAEEKIVEARAIAFETSKKAQLHFERKSKEYMEKVQYAEMQAEKKIQKGQEQMRLNEKARLSAQVEMQKAIELANKAEIIRGELEERLNITIKQALDKEVHVKQQIDVLLSKISLLENEVSSIASEKAKLEENINSNVQHIKKIEMVVTTEKNLRKAIEEKNIELESMLETERKLRKEAEIAKISADEKINRAIEQASKTVLNVLGT